MNFKLFCTALLLAGLTAGPASAQYIGSGAGYSFGYQPNGTLGFGPAYGYGVGLPYWGGGGGILFSPLTGFQPYGSYGFGGYGNLFPNTFQPGGGLPTMTPYGYSLAVPTLGINAPVQPPPGLGAVTPSRRVAGMRQELSDREQADATRTMEDVMSKHPLRQGTVLKVGATAVQVRFEVNGHVHIIRFQPGQVFFFKPDGRLAVATRDASSLHEGDRVLIPEPSWAK